MTAVAVVFDGGKQHSTARVAQGQAMQQPANR